MKSKFFYPTKNMLIGFIISQALPVIVMIAINRMFDLFTWIKFEVVIISCLCLWQVKPNDELDEREVKITLKWKSRILDFGSILIIIPILILSFRPEVSGWDLYILSATPLFFVFVICTMMSKKELGYFFHE